MKIVDSHIHPFIEADENLSFYPGVTTPEQLVSELKRAGINACAGSVIRRGAPRSFADVEAMNVSALRFRDKFGDFYYPGLQIHPDFPDESLRAVEDGYRRGVRLIGELVAYMHGYSAYSHPGLRPALTRAQELGMVLNIHPVDDADTSAMPDLYPDLPIILAHPGEKDGFLFKLSLLKKHKNCYIDLAGTGLFRYGMLRFGIAAVGAGRFLFGSDFPICNPKLNTEGMMFEVQGDELAAIAAGNFLRLLSGAGRNTPPDTTNGGNPSCTQ